MPEAIFSPADKGSLRATIEDAIKQAILHGRLEPGEPLREMQLAKSFGASQATIREALLHLERVGLVVRTENRKTAVASLSTKDVRNTLAVRVPLEVLAAKAAAQRMTKADLEILEKLCGAIARSVSEGTHLETFHADLEFHRFIWKQSDNQLLYEVLNRVTVPLFAVNMIIRSVATDQLRIVVRSHEPIIAAIRENSHHAIEKAIEFHIQTSYD